VEGWAGAHPPTDEKTVNATVTPAAKTAGDGLLLRHCLSLGTAENRVPARRRLDEAIGPELAHRLVAALMAQSRR
jgi:hypothetical protein